jgi:hypothetical protein
MEAVLILPESFKTLRRELGVPYSVVDVGVSQIILNCPGINTFSSQVVTAAVPEHMRMYWKLQPCHFPSFADYSHFK